MHILYFWLCFVFQTAETGDANPQYRVNQYDKLNTNTKEKPNLDDELNTTTREKSDIGENHNIDDGINTNTACTIENSNMYDDLNTNTREKSDVDDDLNTNTREKSDVDDDLNTNTREKSDVDDDLNTNTREKSDVYDDLNTNTREKSDVDDDLNTNTREKSDVDDDINTNTRENPNLDDNSNSFNSCDMLIIEEDYSNDSTKHEDNEVCFNLSSSSLSSSDNDSLSSDEASISQVWKRENTPSPTGCLESMKDNGGIQVVTIDGETENRLSSTSEGKNATGHSSIDVHSNDNQTDVLIANETHSRPMFSPSKLKIRLRDFHLPDSFPGQKSDVPIVIDQDDETTSPTEELSKHFGDTTVATAIPSSNKRVEQSCSDSKMCLKIDNYRSLSSDIVVNVTTPDSTTSTDCCRTLTPQTDQRNAAKPRWRYLCDTMSLPVCDEVIELSDSE